MSFTKKTILVASALAMVASAVNAALLITINSYDSTSIDVTITGTVEYVNSQDYDSLFWGFDNSGDNSWILSGGTNTITNLDASTTYQAKSNGFAVIYSGGWFATNGESSITTGMDVNLRSVTTGASFDWSTYKPYDMVIQAGYSDGSPIIGGTETFTGAVPEPSTYASIAGLAMLGVAAYRRRKGAKNA